MSQSRRYYPPRPLNRKGFSLIESVVSVLLVGVLMVAAMQALGASKRRESDTFDRLRGRQLAGAMLNEILLQAYKEPETDDAPLFGLEPGESTGNRSLFDDVDDYVGWTSSPPNDRSGTALPGFTGWTRSVAVQWADPHHARPDRFDQYRPEENHGHRYEERQDAGLAGRLPQHWLGRHHS